MEGVVPQALLARQLHAGRQEKETASNKLFRQGGREANQARHHVGLSTAPFWEDGSPLEVGRGVAAVRRLWPMPLLAEASQGASLPRRRSFVVLGPFLVVVAGRRRRFGSAGEATLAIRQVSGPLSCAPREKKGNSSRGAVGLFCENLNSRESTAFAALLDYVSQDDACFRRSSGQEKVPPLNTQILVSFGFAICLPLSCGRRHKPRS